MGRQRQRTQTNNNIKTPSKSLLQNSRHTRRKKAVLFLQRPEREFKQNFTTYLADSWQTKEKFPTLDTWQCFLSKQLEEGEITWYMELLDTGNEKGHGCRGGGREEERVQDRKRHLLSHSNVEHGSLTHPKEECTRICPGFVWLSAETFGRPM
jgi:hypothetical protein